MTTEEWLDATAATRPPLTDRQIAILRTVWRPAPNENAAPARTAEAATRSNRSQEGTSHATAV
jgi:hypothetical protein